MSSSASYTDSKGCRSSSFVKNSGRLNSRLERAIARVLVIAMLGVSPGTIKVTAAEIGGGFGGKTVVYLEPLAVRLSQRAGRPVKLVMDRDEVFRASGPTSGTRIKVKMGVTNEGQLTAADVWMGYEAGAFSGSPVGAAGMTVIACYDIPNFFFMFIVECCGFPIVYQSTHASFAAVVSYIFN